MNNRRLDYIFELCAKFIHLRQTGNNRDDAWFKVLEMDKSLTQDDLNALLKLAKDWERREGYKYHNRTNTDDASSTRITPLKRSDNTAKESVIRPLPRAGLTGALNPETLRTYSGQNLEQVLDQVDMPVPVNRNYEPPMPEGSTAPFQPIQTLVEPTKLPNFFGDKTVLLMYFKNLPDPLSFRFKPDQEMVIGRTTENLSMAPEIDLEIVRASEYGISRMHAAMKRDNNQLLITDLGSINHTFINGKRLYPEEIRVLQDWDEVWLARLMCRIHFYHEP